MGYATFGPHTFRLDPTEVKWDFTITAKDTPTIGGKVVQILGAHVEDMTVTGSFGVGGWREQEAFLEQMKQIGDDQVLAQLATGPSVQPYRFRYPPKGWDFGVYLTGYKQPGAFGSVQLDNDTVAPTWQLTFFIVDGGSTLAKIAQDVYISRLATGIGWKQTSFNGPMSWSDVEGVLSGRSVEQYISEQYGLTDAVDSRGSGGSAAMQRAI